MNYCTTCHMNLGDIELKEHEGNTFCPRCETEVMTITNKSLKESIENITNAFYNLNDTTVRKNAKSIIRNAKIIELGERRLQTQLEKRKKQLIKIQHEITVIESIADTLKYDI